MSGRADNASLSKENERFIQQGYYTAPSGATVDLRSIVAEAKRRTMSYDPAATERILSNITTSAAPVHQTRVTVTAESSTQAAERLHREEAQAIAVLNFASARNPGGGYLSGAKAQEEDLCRASALYTTLREAPDFYSSHQRSDGRYSHRLIYSPNVPVYRTSSAGIAPNTLLEKPFTSSFVTSPAPNVGALKKNNPKYLGEVPALLGERAARILALCLHHGAQNLVLGAWGCGVFQNEPSTVARVFHDLLKPGATFHGCFEQVVFAIFDRSRRQDVLKAFCSELGVALPSVTWSPSVDHSTGSSSAPVDAATTTEQAKPQPLRTDGTDAPPELRSSPAQPKITAFFARRSAT